MKINHLASLVNSCVWLRHKTNQQSLHGIDSLITNVAHCARIPTWTCGRLKRSKYKKASLCKCIVSIECWQIAYFQTKTSNLGKFWKVLQYKMLVFFMANLSILWPNGIFYGQMVYFMAKWYILWPNGIFYGQMVYFMSKWYIL
jgi:hypothetical protein